MQNTAGVIRLLGKDEVKMALWDKLGSAGNVVDRRGLGGAVGGGIGIAGVVIALALNYFGIAVDPGTVTNVLGQLNQGSVQRQDGVQPEEFRGEDSYEQFASTILGSTNETWRDIFSQNGETYPEPTLVLFRDGTQSACGGAVSQVGPHYCPADQTIYLDETFFDQLKALGGSNDDVAQAYVIAHEVGHHVQNVTGGLGGRSNAESVSTELQADCYAGLWANSIKHLGVFENGEIQEAISAAAAVGDDRIQQQSGQRVNPESWTHGSSEQRVGAFTTGYQTGNVSSCSFS